MPLPSAEMTWMLQKKVSSFSKVSCMFCFATCISILHYKNVLYLTCLLYLLQ